MITTSVGGWDLYPEYRPVETLMKGDQTADGDSYGWDTIAWSVPCPDHDGCHILAYFGDHAGTHRPVGRTMLSRLPATRDPTGDRP